MRRAKPYLVIWRFSWFSGRYKKQRREGVKAGKRKYTTVCENTQWFESILHWGVRGWSVFGVWKKLEMMERREEGEGILFIML